MEHEKLISNINIWFVGRMEDGEPVPGDMSWFASILYMDKSTEKFNGDVPEKHQGNYNDINSYVLKRLSTLKKLRVSALEHK